MKKIMTVFILVIAFISLLFVSNSFAASTSKNEIISSETKSKLVEIKDSELKSIEDYKDAYGSVTYGTVAYVLNKVRIYSIPLGFLGIAVSAIYQFVLGIRHLESRDKGFNMMITLITLFVICQVLPLVFAIVIKGWRN